MVFQRGNVSAVWFGDSDGAVDPETDWMMMDDQKR